MAVTPEGSQDREGAQNPAYRLASLFLSIQGDSLIEPARQDPVPRAALGLRTVVGVPGPGPKPDRLLAAGVITPLVMHSTLALAAAALAMQGCSLLA